MMACIAFQLLVAQRLAFSMPTQGHPPNGSRARFQQQLSASTDQELRSTTCCASCGPRLAPGTRTFRLPRGGGSLQGHVAAWPLAPTTAQSTRFVQAELQPTNRSARTFQRNTTSAGCANWGPAYKTGGEQARTTPPRSSNLVAWLVPGPRSARSSIPTSSTGAATAPAR